jgi:hypothetical protein
MFELDKYERVIRNYASAHSIDAVVAMKRFVYNLTVLRDYYDDFDDSVDFHSLGQQWNALSSDTRVQQKQDMVKLLSKAVRTRSSQNA